MYKHSIKATDWGSTAGARDGRLTTVIVILYVSHLAWLKGLIMQVLTSIDMEQILYGEINKFI